MAITLTVAAFILCGCGLTIALTTLDSMSDYINHPCVRLCEEGISNRRCEYHWTLEMYYVLSKACFDCPFNLTDCSRPHCVPADGTSRGILTANRRIPGPAIQVCHGDEIIVNVYNRLENSQGTTIHWHGLLQRGSQHMDGTSMVTQCPITYHSTFQYRFVATDRGTHFWHSHAGLQRADGLFGSLIVRQPPSHDVHSALYDFDLPEHVIIVTDWLTELVTSRFASHHHDDGDNKAESMLINGKGAFTPHTDPTTGARVFTPYADFTVRPTFRYRFRVISSGIMNCPIQFSIDNHTLMVIASDGGDFDPIIVDSFNIFSGERFDFILIADKTDELKNYWVRARGIADCSIKKSQQLAVLRYTGAQSGLPELATNYEAGKREGITLNPLNARATDTLVSVDRLNSTEPDDDILKQVPDKRFYLAMDFNQVDNFHFHHPGLYPLSSVVREKHLYSPQINHISFSSAAVPPLTQMKDIDEDTTFCNNETVQVLCDKQFCECTHRLKVALNDVVELIIIDEGVLFNANHPMHLHGFKFRVVGMDRVNSTTSLEEVQALDRAGRLPRKLSRAPLKDTVTVPDGGYTIIRFKADNPGIWLFHCHIAFHGEIGMALLIQAGNTSELPQVPKNFPTCNNWKFSSFESSPQKSLEEVNKACTSFNRGTSNATINVHGYLWCLFMIICITLIRDIIFAAFSQI